MSSAAPPPKPSKKRKVQSAGSKSDRKGSSDDREADRAALHEEIGFESMTLVTIRDRIRALCGKVPAIPPEGFQPKQSTPKGQVSQETKAEGDEEKEDKKTEEKDGIDTNAEQQKGAEDAMKEDKGTETPNEAIGTRTTILPTASKNTIGTSSEYPESLPRPCRPCHFDLDELRDWATALQTALEEFYLLVALVSPATYRWGAERSGAAEQSLTLLSNEFLRSQEQITARVTTRLNDVLAPVVTLVTAKTITTNLTTTTTTTTVAEQDAGAKTPSKTEEVKTNYFVTTYEDPDYVHLSYTILARNAPLLRQIVLANFDKLLRAIDDYLVAQQKDSQHDSRGFVY